MTRWIIPEPNQSLANGLAQELGVLPLTAQALVNRGITSADDAKAFLNPQMNDIADPDLLPGMAAAVERIDRAASDNEKVLVYGDYDVDGTAATALMVKFLRLSGIDADWHVPHRIEEGYGLNLGTLKTFKEKGIKLVITVDCGVSSITEAELLRSEGIDLVVTDHHEPGESVADAVALVNPKLTGSLHPFRELSGVAVAFKLAWGCAKKFSQGKKVDDNFRKFLLDSLGLVALGTIADIVPLLGENRVFVRHGLRALGPASGPGLRALIEVARIRSRQLTTTDVAFALAPRLNAAGRMADAALSAELMLTEDSNRGMEIARQLDSYNRARQKQQGETFQQARQMALDTPGFDSAKAIVLANENWHPGIIGIVASKLVDEFNRPAALVALEGGIGKGSARSVPGFHLFNALEKYRSHMISFGGHSGAAGFQIEEKHIPGLSEHLCKEAAGASPELFQPAIEADAEVTLPELTDRLVNELGMLAPHGERNQPPILIVNGLTVAGEPRLMGVKGTHVSFYVSDGQSSYRAVAFGKGGEIYDAVKSGKRKCSLACTPRIDTYNGSGEVELLVKDLKLE